MYMYINNIMAKNTNQLVPIKKKKTPPNSNDPFFNSNSIY